MVENDRQDQGQVQREPEELEDFGRVSEPWWARLRPPDVWDTPAPTLREEIALARRGDHLPQSGPWRAAEITRTSVSTAINAVLLLLVHINRSAARQAVLLAFIGALALVLALR
ncbi:hypothetical protein [Nocardiopsis sp. L17-MgMaSL7]|uniref:hypothetical protein n=1 Tax=Nocardiopsis sp. L17-MgMaSL7 TaxID=1938893 RepID=UPI000D7114FF|nr:hypothetical protein [Nocardiopsis sp. L17-MgMaSL7]